VGLRHPVPRGTILVCDFDTGFREPEMVKRRPVVVVSGRLRVGAVTCTVVPLSTSPPDRVEGHHVLLRLHPPLPPPFDAAEMWAKCDMLATVAFWRLDLPRGPRSGGKRDYAARQVPLADLVRIQAAIAGWLGIRTGLA